MEMFVPQDQDRSRYENNLHLNMDYDSGYISHNPESNLDSSGENMTEVLKEDSPNKPMFLSEDALLEKPEVCSRYFNLSKEIENEDYEETRKLFNLSDAGSETVLSGSAESRELSYSGFDNESDISDIEIPNANKIVVDNFSLVNTLAPNEDSGNQLEDDCVTEENNSCWRTDEDFKGFSLSQKQSSTAFSNITNTLATSDPKKKLTLIFSKCDKENVYTVKRKYRSLTPDCSMTSENLEDDCEEPSEAQSKVPNDITSDAVVAEAHADQKEYVSDMSLEENCVEVEESEGPKLSPCEKKYSPSESFPRNFVFEPVCEQAVGDADSEHVVPKIEDAPKEEITIEENLLETPEIVPKVEVRTEVEEKKTECAYDSKNDTPDTLTKAEHVVPKIEDATMEEIKIEENVLETPGTVPKLEVKTEVEDIKPECAYDSKNDTLNTLAKAPETPKRKYQITFNGSESPDIFEDVPVEKKVLAPQPPPTIKEEQYVHRKDKTLLRKAQNHLKGVLPPHSVTVIYMSVDEMLNRLDVNKDYFWTKCSGEPKSDVSMEGAASQSLNQSSSSEGSNEGGLSKSLLVSCSLEDCMKKGFPEVLEDRCHGLYHNRSKLSEEFEDLCTKYGQRYVGAETQSTCSVFESISLSPMKRKQMKQRWAVKSPGRRLSHLARRRITFSSVNLQTGSSTFAGSRARQILVDTKKLDQLSRRKSPRKTPKKTPGKSPRIKTRTPSSSAKKKLAMRFRKVTGEIEKTTHPAETTSLSSSRRALFASPDCDKKSSLFMPGTSGLSTFHQDRDAKKPSTKRALFASPNRRSPLKRASPFKRASPYKRSPFRRLDAAGAADKKRKRAADPEDAAARPSKQARSHSFDARPSEHKAALERTRSDSMLLCQGRSQPVEELSAVHKKKLQWAVYEALRAQNVTPAHAQFKLFASILARLTRRFLPNLSASAPRPEGGTSDRMLRIARHHVFAVIKGKSVDEIYNEHVKARARLAKPHGYVSVEEFVERRENKENEAAVGVAARGVASRRGEGGAMGGDSKVERIRKAINFGDDDR